MQKVKCHTSPDTKIIGLLKIVNPFQSTQPFLYIQTQTPRTLLSCNRSGPAHTGEVTSTEKLKHIRVLSIVNPFLPNWDSLKVQGTHPGTVPQCMKLDPRYRCRDNLVTKLKIYRPIGQKSNLIIKNS